MQMLGGPDGIRTRVAGLKGRSPGPLDDGAAAKHTLVRRPGPPALDGAGESGSENQGRNRSKGSGSIPASASSRPTASTTGAASVG